MTAHEDTIRQVRVRRLDCEVAAIRTSNPQLALRVVLEEATRWWEAAVAGPWTDLEPGEALHIEVLW